MSALAFRNAGAPGADAAGLATLTIEDDGVGFDHTRGSKRHGLGFVKRVMETVNGMITLATDHGTRWIMTIPTVGNSTR